MGILIMTNRAKPFLLKPSGKNYIWGGNRLKYNYSKDLDMEPLAETWECSTHPDGPSYIGNGLAEGFTLREVLMRHPEFLGTHPGVIMPEGSVRKGELPILIKLIDAKNNLSIQVHPDDQYAKKHEGGSGKTELWYVLEAEEDTSVFYGFYHDISREQLQNSLKAGTVETYLHKVKIHRDDVFFIPPGTVHAIGAGALIAEVQENSNITYRLYDYGRLGHDGRPRQLHIDKALEVACLSASSRPRQPMRTLRYRPGYASELLGRCKYFQVERILINTESNKNMAGFQTDETSFQVFLCYGGCGVLMDQEDHAINFFKGDCIFVPACSVPLRFHGCSQMLSVRC